MVPSNNTRKRFSLVLNFPPLYKPSLDGLRSPDAADSLASASLSPRRASFFPVLGPRPPASLHLKQEQPPLPLTDAEGLDPSEKMKLVRKNRKLSRLFGEAPHPIPISVDAAHTARPVDVSFDDVPEEPATASTFAAPSLRRKPSLKRSATSVSAHAAPPTPPSSRELHRARSFGTPRPSITIPPAAVTARASPVSPIKFAWAQQDVEPVPPLPSSPEYTSPPRGSMARRGSAASSTYVPDPEQVRRARVAKLAQQLGESVPPELLVRASSPHGPPPSPSAISFKDGQDARKGSMGKAKATGAMKRLSLDVRALVRGTEQPLLSESAKERALKRARSGRGVEGRPSAEGSRHTDDDVELGDSPEEDIQHLTEKQRVQRVLNVKRARKMNQMFGNDPPLALYQITNIQPRKSSTVDRPSLSPIDDVAEQDSPLSPLAIHNFLRDSTATASSSDAISPLVFADRDSLPPTEPPTPQLRYADLEPEGDTEADPRTPTHNLRSKPSSIQPSLSMLSVNTSTSALPSPTGSQHSTTPFNTPSLPTYDSRRLTYTFQQSNAPSPPPSPPLFSAMFIWDPPEQSQQTPVPAPQSAPADLAEPAGVHPSDPEFRTRRIRAAKLSRFFGVGLHDIAGVLPTGAPLVPVESRRSEAPSRAASTRAGTVSTRSSETAGGAPLTRRRTSSSGRRSRSVPRRQADVPPLPPQPSLEQAEGKPRTSGHGRAYSTTVEAFGDGGYGALAFMESRKRGEVHELEMRDVIKQLRKIK